jgi:hypothetical protein
MRLNQASDISNTGTSDYRVRTTINPSTTATSVVAISNMRRVKRHAIESTDDEQCIGRLSQCLTRGTTQCPAFPEWGVESIRTATMRRSCGLYHARSSSRADLSPSIARTTSRLVSALDGFMPGHSPLCTNPAIRRKRFPRKRTTFSARRT